MLTDKDVKIRKPHRCYGCERKFEPGTIMRYSTYSDDGQMGSSYMCHTCLDIANYVFEPGEELSPAFTACVLDDGQSPEQLLQSLKEGK